MRRRLVLPSALAVAAALAACGTTEPVPTGSCDAIPIQLGTVTSGAFSATDCNIGGVEQIVDNYRLTLPAPTYVRLAFGATGFTGDFELDVYAQPVELVNFIASQDVPSVHYAALPAGDYLIMMQSFGAAGSYTILPQAMTELNGCYETQNSKVFLRPGSSVAGRIDASDCAVPSSSVAKLDRYWMPMLAWKDYTFSTTGEFGLRLEVMRDNVECVSAFGAAGTTSVTCAVTTTGMYNINVIGPNASAGNYVLTVSQPTP